MTAEQVQKAMNDGEAFARPFHRLPRWLQEEGLRYALGTLLASPSSRIDGSLKMDLVKRGEVYKWYKALYRCSSADTSPSGTNSELQDSPSTATPPPPPKTGAKRKKTAAGIAFDDL